jgi:hypothetical protein
LHRYRIDRAPKGNQSGRCLWRAQETPERERMSSKAPTLA